MFRRIATHFNPKVIGMCFAITLFLLYLPIISQINFMQNDDWYYYAQVERFLDGNFTLLPEIAPTFYLQGLIGSIFALAFGIDRLPFFTLFVAAANFFIFYLILTHLLKKSVITSLLLSSLLFFNPLFQYSLAGFMTEQYFLIFLLFSFYFFIKYEEKNHKKYLLYFNIFALLGLLIRQVSLLIPFSTAVYLLFRRNWKAFGIQVVATITMGLVYLFIPKTSEMGYKTFQFHHFLELNYIYSIFYGSLVYLSAFTIPVLFIITLKYFREKLWLKAALTVFLFALMQFLFKPMTVSWGEFPYFENTWERTGFLPRDSAGTKYQFMGNYDLYRYWDIFAKVLVAGFISTVITADSETKKRLLNMDITFIFLYLILMFLTVTFYDRYILVLLPVFLLFLARTLVDVNENMFTQNNRMQNVIIGLFSAFLAFYSYNILLDFMSREQYIWDKAEQLVADKQVRPNYIFATTAWNEKHGTRETLSEYEYKYKFSYDSPEVGREIAEGFQLLEVKEIRYPLNFFINPKIYLYEKSL